MKKEQLKRETKNKVSSTKSPLQDKVESHKSLYNSLGLSIIIILGIIIYSNSFICSFHLDDIKNFVEDTKFPGLTDFKAWWDFSHTRAVAFYSFALNIHFNQFDVWGYHLVNLIIHLVNVLVVWWLSILIFSSPVIRDHPIAKYKNEIAFITALLFISHPLATQSVTYIVQRMASMVAMFYLLSIALYLKARLADNASLPKYLLFAGSILSALLAMLTKENAFTLPFAIVLVEFFFLRSKQLKINFRDYRSLLAIVGLIGFIILVVLKFSFSILKPINPNEVHAGILTPITYLFTQFSVIVKYIQLLFLPINQMVDYDIPVANSLFEIKTLLCFLVLLSLIFFAIFIFNKNRIISFGIFWFFLTLAIESSIIPINDVIFEHRTYLPSVGFFLILSSGIYLLLREKNKLLVFAIFAVIIVMNSFLTFQRNKIWKDDISLWSDNISKAPNKSRPYYCRGSAYAKLEKWDKAIADFSSAIRIFPNYSFAYANRGVAYGKRKEWDKSISDQSAAIAIDSKHATAYFNRGANYGELKQWDNAIKDYTSAISINPDYSDAYSNRGIAFGRMNEWEKAIADHTKSIQIDPKQAKAYSNRGIAFGNLMQWDKAIADYSRAITNNPNYANAYNNRGSAYENLGEHEKAIADFTKALQIDPNMTVAQNNRELAIRNLQSEKKR